VGGAGQVEDDFPKKYNVCHCIRYKWATAGRRLEGIFILHTQTPGSSYQSAEENRGKRENPWERWSFRKSKSVSSPKKKIKYPKEVRQGVRQKH